MVLSFVLMMFGAITDKWWLVYFTGLVAFGLYPTPDTFWFLVACIVIAWIWARSFSELTSHGFLLIVVLLSAAIVALALDQVFLGIIATVALAFLLLLTPAVKISKKTARKARSEFDDLHAGLKKAKGQHPDFYGQAEALSNQAGSITGEAIVTNPNQKLVSNDLMIRVSQASKNLIDGFWKWFK